MSRHFKSVFLLGAALLLCACAALIPHEYKITHERLVRKLEQSFPLHKAIDNGLFDVTLDIPDIRFITEQNRISLAAHFSAHSILVGGLQGQLTITSALRYDTLQRALYFQDAHLESLHIEPDDARIEVLRPALDVMLGEYFRANPLYRLQSDELRFAGTEIDISNIKVLDDGVELLLTPKR